MQLARCQRWVRRCSASSRLASDAQPNLAERRSVLRPYQDSVINRALELYGKGTRRLLVPLATGLGKTVIFTHLPQAFPELSKRGTLVLVHRDELVQQAVESFRKFLPHLSVGVEKGPLKAHPGLDVVVSSVQTLGRRGSGSSRLRKYANYAGVVIVDEAHHIKAGGMYDNILNGLGVGSACAGQTRDGRLLAGFTATPKRADGLSLRPFFDHSIGGLDLHWGITNGYLVDIHAYAVTTATDIGSVPSRLQDFSSGALSTAVNNDLRNEAAARAMLEFGARHSASGAGSEKRTPRGIAFCVDVRHAHDLARVLNEHGVSALAIDGAMNKQERRRALSAFRAGEVSTLTNCGVLTEGFDAPFCDTVVMCRPTQSAPLYMQMMGRGTRPWLPTRAPEAVADGTSATRHTVDSVESRKTAIATSLKPRMHVIDLVDNCGKHKVMSVSAALGLSPDFRGDAYGEGFSVQHVGGLAAEVLSLVDPDAVADSVGDDSPLAKAKTPQELALLVKHYRLLEGARAAETIVTASTGGINGKGCGDTTDMSPAWDVTSLCVGDRVGKDYFLRVTVEAINTGQEDGEEEARDEEHDASFDSDERYYDPSDDDDFDCDVEDNSPRTWKSLRVKTAGTSNSRSSRDDRLARRTLKKLPKHHSRLSRKQSPSAATVHMRHNASGVLFTWRTAGVKDTSGTELHEGQAYRLVGSVRDTPDAARREVPMTRCRLTMVEGFQR